MPRYKINVPQSGTWLYGDGPPAVVAETLDEAREHYGAADGALLLLHSQVGSCRAVTKAALEGGECHDGAAVGDTTVDYFFDDGGDLGSNQVRVWQEGPPSPHWQMESMPLPAIDWRSVPVGAEVYSKVFGWGRVIAPLRQWRASGQPLIPIRFSSGVERTMLLGHVSIHCSADVFPAPEMRFRVIVDGEIVVDDAPRGIATALRDLRIERLQAEWVAQQYVEHERSLRNVPVAS